MATKYYLAIADRQPDEANWSVTFPDFPGVTSVAAKFSEVMRQAKDALATAVEDMEREGETLPPQSRTMPSRIMIAAPTMIRGRCWCRLRRQAARCG